MWRGVTFVALETDWREADAWKPFRDDGGGDRRALLSPFVLPFEIASVLLVVAMVGAIVLVREDGLSNADRCG